MSAAPTDGGASARVPGAIEGILDRAAMQLCSQWPALAVVFPWWSDGIDTEYRARLVWLEGEPAPRVQVHDARSGDFVCRSRVADWFAIDAARPAHDLTDEELQRRAHLEATQPGRARPWEQCVLIEAPAPGPDDCSDVAAPAPPPPGDSGQAADVRQARAPADGPGFRAAQAYVAGLRRGRST